MRTDARQADLYLNDERVGTVAAAGFSDSWGYGRFEPAEEFSRFAVLFGAWSLLIHEDDDADRTSREALEELRRAELAIDELRAELRWAEPAERVSLSQINIDGPMIEWKRR